MVKYILLLALTLFKSLFSAITQVAWGLISIWGFNALLFYLHETRNLDITLVSKTFLDLEYFIMNHIMLFVFVFFILYAYFEIKEVIK